MGHQYQPMVKAHVGAAGGQRETAWIKEPRSLPLHFQLLGNYERRERQSNQNRAAG